MRRKQYLNNNKEKIRQVFDNFEEKDETLLDRWMRAQSNSSKLV